MRSIFGGLAPAVVCAVVVIELFTCPWRAMAQSAASAAATRAADPPTAHNVVQMASAGDVALSSRAAAAFQSAQRLLFEGRYPDATASFDSALEHRGSVGADTMATWAHHGMAVAEAFAGHVGRARMHYDAALRAPALPTFALADSIEAAVLTGQHSKAEALLDRFADSHPSVLAQQYVHSFRALDRLFASDCASAIAELKRAPDEGRPLPQAIRGACAARAGRHTEALVLRDSVLTHPLADPHSWPMIIARGVALRIR